MPNLPNRDAFERVLTEQLSKAMVNAQKAFARSLFREGLTYGDLHNISPLEYDNLRKELEQILNEQLVNAYIEAIRNFTGILSFSVDESRARELAETWARQYVPQLALNIINTTRTNLARIADRSPSVPLNRVLLVGLLASVLSAARASQIAITEVSNAISNGEASVSQEMMQSGASIVPIWYTQLDERVCFRCSPRHGKMQGDNWSLLPPAHPNCRCYLGYEVITSGGSRQVIFDDEIVLERLRRNRNG